MAIAEQSSQPEKVSSLRSLIQPVSVSLSGLLSGNPNRFDGKWVYLNQDRAMEFSYQRTLTSAAAPSWHIALMQGQPPDVVLNLWDPPEEQPGTSASAESSASLESPENQSRALTPLLPVASSLESWVGPWEGSFWLRKNGRDTPIRERFVLFSSGDGDGVTHVSGGGTNTYGRFVLNGTVDAEQKLVLSRAYGATIYFYIYF